MERATSTSTQERGVELWQRAVSRGQHDLTRGEIHELLIHPNSLFRSTAAKLLGTPGDESDLILLSQALNDRALHVAEEAAGSLARIASPRALAILSIAFLHDELERPHHLAQAIATFGDAGYECLLSCLRSASPTIRYFAARGLSSAGREEAIPTLQTIAEQDVDKTRFGGEVAGAARKALKALRKNHGSAHSR